MPIRLCTIPRLDWTRLRSTVPTKPIAQFSRPLTSILKSDGKSGMVDGSLSMLSKSWILDLAANAGSFCRNSFIWPKSGRMIKPIIIKIKIQKASNARIIATTRDSLIMPCAMRTCAIALTSG